CPRHHAMAVGIAIIPHVSDLLVKQWGSMMQALRDMGASSVPPALTDPELVKAMLQQGAYVTGHATVAGGAIVVGLLWGAASAALIDKQLKKAAGFFLAAALLSYVGVIHSPQMQMALTSHVGHGYLLAAAVCFALGSSGKDRLQEISLPREDTGNPSV
ncbi:MAG TPA: xanthine/uracil/vitamin C permease, partial [Kiritimatiellia bacterium]|nr:xanthine/uracil/vitamin C permease [Kiritimatiellia bacterium]